MASSAGDYEVITPVQTKAATVQDDSLVDSALAGLVKQEHAGASVAEEVAQGTTTDVDVGVPAAGEEYVEGSTNSFTGIEVNGTSYVEASPETDPWSCMTVNGIKYVQQNMGGPYRKTANDLVCDTEYVQAESQKSPQQAHSREGFKFSGEPIKVYVGTESIPFSVHASILVQSTVIGRMPLDKADDGSYSINLPDEDPKQFMRLLTYMYRGAWDFDMVQTVEPCCWDGSCQMIGKSSFWDNKKLMQLNASGCKYNVYGLTDKVAPKLDLKGGLAEFCEAFKYSYEKCPGNHALRELFKKNLATVFENCVGRMGDAKMTDQIPELASGGGDFAVDLIRALAAAQEDAVLTKLDNELGWRDCEPRRPSTRSDCEEVVVNGGWVNNMDAPRRPETTQEDVMGTKDDWISSTPPIYAAPPAPTMQEDVNGLQDRVLDLEEKMTHLQLRVDKPAHTQHGDATQKTLLGNSPAYLPTGWGSCCPPTPANVPQPGAWVDFPGY